MESHGIGGVSERPPGSRWPIGEGGVFYEALVQMAAHLCRAPMASLYLVDEEGSQLQLKGSVGLPEGWIAATRRVSIDARGLPCGAAVARKAPVVETELSGFPYAPLADEANIRTILAQPLIDQTGRAIGVLVLYYDARTELPSTPDTVKLQEVARHLSRMIEMGGAPPLAGWEGRRGTYAPPPSGTVVTAAYPYGLVQGMLRALEVRDAETIDHSRRVTTYTLLLAEQMGLEATRLPEMALGAALHDIGKIGVPDGILHKPGKLTPEEWAVVKKHPEIGAQMLKELTDYFPGAIDLVLYHHERFDGKGYPRGLAGTSIPLPARMFAVVDAFDAMTSDRPYRLAIRIDMAREELRRSRGSQLCPRCVDAFLALDPKALAAVRDGVLDRFGEYFPHAY